jgi:DNA-binding XRE family transcriptional regulator
VKTLHDVRYRRVVEHLRAARQKCGLTQEDVAAQLGWHRTVICNIETQERRADVLEVYRLCRLYGVEFSAVAGWIRDATCHSD